MRAQSQIGRNTSVSRVSDRFARVDELFSQTFVDRSPGLNRERGDLFAGVAASRLQSMSRHVGISACHRIANRKARTD